MNHYSKHTSAQRAGLPKPQKLLGHENVNLTNEVQERTLARALRMLGLTVQELTHKQKVKIYSRLCAIGPEDARDIHFIEDTFLLLGQIGTSMNGLVVMQTIRDNPWFWEVAGENIGLVVRLTPPTQGEGVE